MTDDVVLGALAEARALGFLGPGPLASHVASAEAFAAALGDLRGPALDLGSGGGVPGLLLAGWYPEISWTLLDRHRRRTSFLARTVATLGWVERVRVVRASAEEAAHDPAHRGRYQAVTARSLAVPAITAEVAVGFLATEGRLVVAEPPASTERDRWPVDGLQGLGLVAEPSPPGTAVLRLTMAAAPDVPRAWRSVERHPRW